LVKFISIQLLRKSGYIRARDGQTLAAALLGLRGNLAWLRHGLALTAMSRLVGFSAMETRFLEQRTQICLRSLGQSMVWVMAQQRLTCQTTTTIGLWVHLMPLVPLRQIHQAIPLTGLQQLARLSMSHLATQLMAHTLLTSQV
jgi:hypothetical protein